MFFLCVILQASVDVVKVYDFLFYWHFIFRIITSYTQNVYNFKSTSWGFFCLFYSFYNNDYETLEQGLASYGLPAYLLFFVNESDLIYLHIVCFCFHSRIHTGVLAAETCGPPSLQRLLSSLLWKVCQFLLEHWAFSCISWSPFG